MTKMADRPARVPSDLLDAAAVEAVTQRRSAKQQLEHWTRVGRAVSARTDRRRRIEDAIAGRLPARELTSDEQIVANAEIDAAIVTAARNASFGKQLASEAAITVALNEQGELTRYYPDGRTETLS